LSVIFERIVTKLKTVGSFVTIITTMNGKNSRLRRVTDILRVKNAGTIREIAQALSVSEMTIRRDLATLAERNIVKLIHGGAIFNHVGLETTEPDGGKYDLPQEEATHIEEKRRIAEKAVSLIEPNDVIIIDSGSTTELMGEFIQSSSPSTIICYAMNILVSVFRRKECKLIFGGGYFHENTMMFESNEGVELIRNNRANKAFMSARGISDKLGITTADSYEISVKKAALESSQQRILLADSSKFDQVHSAHYSELGDFDIIITDSNISPKYVDLSKVMGFELIVV